MRCLPKRHTATTPQLEPNVLRATSHGLLAYTLRGGGIFPIDGTNAYLVLTPCMSTALLMLKLFHDETGPEDQLHRASHRHLNFQQERNSPQQERGNVPPVAAAE
jgi:hypothetical protein